MWRRHAAASPPVANLNSSECPMKIVERTATRPKAMRRTGVMLLAVTLVLPACGNDDTDSGDATSSTSTTTTTTSATTEKPVEVPEDTARSATGTVFDVTFAGGEVTGGGRQEVGLGDTVTIRVTSDVTDRIHLHGYDLQADVPAGETAELTFDATIPGVFEVELEDAGIPLLELEIS